MLSQAGAFHISARNEAYCMLDTASCSAITTQIVANAQTPHSLTTGSPQNSSQVLWSMSTLTRNKYSVDVHESWPVRIVLVWMQVTGDMKVTRTFNVLFQNPFKLKRN
jgi:hypothetical protein